MLEIKTDNPEVTEAFERALETRVALHLWSSTDEGMWHLGVYQVRGVELECGHPRVPAARISLDECEVI